MLLYILIPLAFANPKRDYITSESDHHRHPTALDVLIQDGYDFDHKSLHIPREDIVNRYREVEKNKAKWKKRITEYDLLGDVKEKLQESPSEWDKQWVETGYEEKLWAIPKKLFLDVKQVTKAKYSMENNSEYERSKKAKLENPSQENHHRFRERRNVRVCRT